MSRKRHQQGSLRIVRGRWIAQWWDEGHRRKKMLGKKSSITKSQAQNELAAILAPINGIPAPININQQAPTITQQAPAPERTFKDFVDSTYLRFYRRKWKHSTAACNEDRLNR